METYVKDGLCGAEADTENGKNGVTGSILPYDKLLSDIDFYKVHPGYLPFIGDKYNEYKILHIGESHYIGQKNDPEAEDKYPITYFENWWTDCCPDLYNEYGGWYNTRKVIENYLSGERRKGHSIFSETVKVFDKVYLGRDKVRMDHEESMNYHYFAFMNFFQMPSIYEGVKYWNSLWDAANKLGNKQLAYDMWEKAAQVSSEVVDDVIDILKPSVVIFTSASAKGAYDEYGKHRSEPYVISSVHPGCSWWNRPLKRYNGLTGKQELERQLSELKNK